MISELRIRERIEAREESLSPYAVKSRLSRGRQKAEDPDPVRTCFQRDRDRIIHSKAFRRLKHKTQVFIAPLGDHFVTRLTHTLEVTQIARTIARALNLNEDLTEAICLGHDLGHTPFGHAGEEVLNELYPKGFHHNEQSLRVVDRLEKNGQGLNLSWEVRDGILNHSKSRSNILGEAHNKAVTFEGQICRIADAVAYINHDILDSIRAGIIKANDLPLGAVSVLGNSHSQRINTMVCDIIKSSWSCTGLIPGAEPEVTMSNKVLGASNTLRDFLFEQVYQSKDRKAEHEREIVRLLYKYLVDHQDLLPMEYIALSDKPEQRVVDYIAGMTDLFALRLAKELNLAE
ncbi:MAG: deoxyguanosinetriphosphate triphosphohydrolase [Dehalococcoides mccartyi]|uniref:deoxyguanosinetriphosphate triphosphohydrolase n=1 Tax=Dehalococcoides mccartyi TaxID=61435 RepID=UPI0030F55D0B